MSAQDDQVAELARLAADPTMAHTGPRWRLHAIVHPHAAADAIELAAGYATRDAALLITYRALLAELDRTLPDDELAGYCRWAIGHLHPAAGSSDGA